MRRVCFCRRSRCRRTQKLGDEIEVFLYKDSKDRIIATTNQPKLTLGGLAVLEVAEIGKNRCVPGLGTGKRPVSSI